MVFEGNLCAAERKQTFEWELMASCLADFVLSGISFLSFFFFFGFSCFLLLCLIICYVLIDFKLKGRKGSLSDVYKKKEEFLNKCAYNIFGGVYNRTQKLIRDE